MTSNEIDELVFDALYFRRTIPDTCLQTNIAGRELELHSADALPQIEHTLSTVVVPGLAKVQKRLFPGSTDKWYEEDPFPGLNGLLGAYLLIGSKHDIFRAIDFLRTLPPSLLAKAVAIVPTFFRKVKFRLQEKETNEQKQIPSEQLLSLIKELTQSADPILRENAGRVMSFYEFYSETLS